MLSRVRQALWLSLGLLIGYAIGSGPFAEWVVDVYHMIGVEWRLERTARGPSGTFPLLLSGFLLGQGLYLSIQRLVAGMGKSKAKRIERIAAWDPALRIATRFGLHSYLQQCATWAAEDPTTRTQTLALFKIKGLGKLNDSQGPHAATTLLQRVSAELRLAALPEATSTIRQWLVHYMPRPFTPTLSGLPSPRFPARWSGATFALAFRELDALQAVAIVRDLTAWIRSELKNADASEGLTLHVGVAIGSPSVTSRGLVEGATLGLSESSPTLVSVVHDPGDPRGAVIAQLSDVSHRIFEMQRTQNLAGAAALPNFAQRTRLALRAWGAPVACFVATFVILQMSGARGQVAIFSYPWPNTLKSMPIVDENGPREVKMVWSDLPDRSNANWKLTDVKIVQAAPSDGHFKQCQIQLSVKNTSNYTYYVSSDDFTVIDEMDHRHVLDPRPMVRLARGITGKWIGPGETWAGAIQLTRDSAITGLVFHPDRFTNLVTTANATGG